MTNISGFEAFVCELYGKPKTNSTSAVRFAIFRDKYAPTNMASPLDKLRGADSSALPSACEEGWKIQLCIVLVEEGNRPIFA